MLEEYGITPSMSRKGNCWDNACSETLFGSLKVERLHGQRFATIRQAKDATIASYGIRILRGQGVGMQWRMMPHDLPPWRVVLSPDAAQAAGPLF